MNGADIAAQMYTNYVTWQDNFDLNEISYQQSESEYNDSAQVVEEWHNAGQKDGKTYTDEDYQRNLGELEAYKAQYEASYQDIWDKYDTLDLSCKETFSPENVQKALAYQNMMEADMDFSNGIDFSEFTNQEIATTSAYGMYLNENATEKEGKEFLDKVRRGEDVGEYLNPVAVEYLQAEFDSIDTDEDDIINYSELSAYYKALDDADGSDDGKFTMSAILEQEMVEE